MTPEAKTDQVLALVTERPVDVERLAKALEAELTRTMLRLRRDDRFDLVSVRVTSPYPLTIRIEGFGLSERRRLDAAAVFENREASVMLILTRGEGIADLERPIFGAVGPEIGNPPLLPRLLDATIPVFVKEGVRAIVNDPVDERVRTAYASLGFVDGKRLALNDRPTLLRVFRTIATAAAGFELELCAMPL